MDLPLQITFKDIEPSEAVASRIRERAEKLQQFHPRITDCRVVVEAPHQRHNKGKLYRLGLRLVVPHGRLAVSKDAHDKHAHEDIYVAVRNWLPNAMEAKLRGFVRKQRGEIKAHRGAGAWPRDQADDRLRLHRNHRRAGHLFPSQ